MNEVSKFKVSWLVNIEVHDELHIGAIDNLILWQNPCGTTSNVKGVQKIDSLWVPMDGLHSLNFSATSYIHAERRLVKEKPNYIIKTAGNIPAKIIYNILEAKRMEITNEALISAINNYIITELHLKSKGRIITDVVPVPMDGIYTIADISGDYMIAKKKQQMMEKVHI